LQATIPKKSIPHYPLQQTGAGGNELFEIKELDGKSRPNDHLFIPHYKDYYLFFLVKQGGSRHWIDFISQEWKPGNLYFTLPRNIQLEEDNAPVCGTLLAFTEAFLSQQDLASWKKLPILQNPDDIHELKLSGEEIASLDNLFIQMRAGYNGRQDRTEGDMRSWLNMFLVSLSRIYTRQYNAHPLSDDQWMVSRMKDLLHEKYDPLLQVADYAEILDTTPGQLNHLLRAYTGRTTTVLLQERLLLEAKKALVHASLSVKEIACSLGFEDAGFHRFFKRFTGETPAAFRAAARRDRK
jgi:AraC family transcriptional regulator, transcriptional activator of pobA